MVDIVRAKMILHCIVGSMEPFSGLPETSKSRLIFPLKLLEVVVGEKLRATTCCQRSSSVVGLLLAVADAKVLGCPKHNKMNLFY
jgi:hypothetical protein